MQAQRLRRTRDIELVRSHGRPSSTTSFTMRARRNGLETVRLAVSAIGSIGSAARRNRARRRVREAIRGALRDRSSAPGTDLFVVARPAVLDAPAERLRVAVARELEAALGSGSQ